MPESERGPSARTSIDLIRRMWDHVFDADARIARAVHSAFSASDAATDADLQGAMRELAHIVGAEETWLARIEGRSARLAVWPEIPLEALTGELERVHTGYRTLLDSLTDNDLVQPVKYTNSAGQEFTNGRDDILMHAALHSQYHRGKVNQLLRRSGALVAPVDFIAFVRGAPAAVTRVSTGDP
jgi:uncharacterized damage-inducible protein DinB